MKKIYTLFTALLINILCFAQTPEKMTFQAVIRDASNALLVNQSIGMQISILQGSSSGTAVYVETQTPTSNANGLVSIEIGGGTMVSGDISTIDWANGPYFIKTETDPTGGTTYTITGTSKLLSVPYALYAENSGDTTKWQLNGDSLYYNNGNVGINTLSPRAYLHVNSSSTKTALLIENTGTTSAKIVLNQAGSANGQPYFIVSRNDGKFVIGNASNGIAAQIILDSLGNVGIGTASPARKLHVNNVMRLEPRATAPTLPAEGDMYMDSTTHKLMVYDGSTWRACW